MEAKFNQALALHKAGRLDEAEALYRLAATWRPEWTLGNLGVLLRVTGRLDEAEDVLRAALRAQPGNPAVQYTLGMTLLQAGKYPEGWRLYESRRVIHPPNHPLPPMPEWRGEPLKGKTLLVVGEQGLGDQILLARFIPLLAERAARVMVATTKPLVRLLSGLGGDVFNPNGWDGVEADYWTFAASAPGWLGAGPRDVPTVYLHADERGPGAGVGLMLQGDARNANNAHRLPSAAVARAIRGLASFTDLSPEATGARDFAETAELISALELVVTVDTSVAHLAGAMGKPCWILMSRPAIDWYANWSGNRTPWYDSARLFRQPRPGDWAGVLAELDQALGGI